MPLQATTAKRVLIVEDDPVVAMLVEDIVRDMGHEVLVNLTLDHAMLELEAGGVDMVLLDMRLRGESARPVLLELVARRIPFMVLSGLDQSELRAEFPYIQVLPKPFCKADLEQAVQQLAVVAETTRPA